MALPPPLLQSSFKTVTDSQASSDTAMADLSKQFGECMLGEEGLQQVAKSIKSSIENHLGKEVKRLEAERDAAKSRATTAQW